MTAENEAPLHGATAADDEASSDAPAERRRGRRALGCLGRMALAAAIAVVLIIIIGETFDQGDDAKQPSRGFNAGTAEEYARSDVSYVPTEHTYIVRLADGSFLALYDKSSKEQESDGNCRVTYDETAQLFGVPQLEGFSGAFVEECEGLRTTWRADGTFAAGAGYGDLDRFSSRIDEETGDLIVSTRSRTCTRSRGVPGLPPYIERTCGSPD